MPRGEQFAVDAPVAPAGVLAGRAQCKQPDGPHGPRPAWAPGAGSGRVTAGQQVAVPAERRVGTYQQPDAAGRAVGEPLQEGGQECAVTGGEPRPSCRVVAAGQ
jgi:hypothetical protein